MTIKMQRVKNLICFLMQYIFFYTFLLFIELIYSPDHIHYLASLWVGLFLICSFLLRYVINNTLLFSIAQLLLVCTTVPFCNNIKAVLFYIILVFSMLCLSFYNRFKESTIGFTPCSPGCLILNVTALLYAIYLHKSTPCLILFLLSVCLLLLYLSYVYFHNLELFFAKDAHTVEQMNKMLSVNHHMVILFFLASFIILFAFYFLHLGNYLLWLLRYLVALIAYVVMWFIKLIPDTIYNPQTSLAPLTDIGDVSGSRGNSLAGFFFIIVALTLICIATYYSLRLLIHLYRHHLQKSAPKTDHIEYIKPPSKVAILPLKKEAQKSEKKERSPLMKLRKIYKKTITGYKKHSVAIKPNSTPKSLKEEIFLRTSEDLTTLTTLYEKSRYGTHTVTKEDLKNIKNKE